MVTVAYRRPAAAKAPAVSLVLLDWSCRESFHSLDYLAEQTVDRDDYEIIWIEFYQQRAAELDKKLADYSARGRPAPIDLWTIMGMDRSLYYHKHLMYNIGIVQSRGDIVVICDSDAMFPPDFVETVITTFRENPNIVVHFLRAARALSVIQKTYWGPASSIGATARRTVFGIRRIPYTRATTAPAFAPGGPI